MKKVLLALVAVASLAACKRDEERKEPTIVGVWKKEKDVVIDGKDNSVKEDFPTECEKKGSVEFTKDGKVMSRSFTTDNGNCIEDGSENGTYVYNASNKSITLTMRGETKEAKVISLTDDEFQVSVEMDINGDNIKDKAVSHYKRQK